LAAIELAEDEIWEQLTIAGKPLYTIEFPENDKISVEKAWLSEERMAALLNSHDVLILPYNSATQSGMVTLGISAAIPMICTSVGGLVEQLSENEAIWVEPNPESLLKGIRFISQNPVAYEAILQKLLEKKKHFSWTEPARQLAMVFTKYLPASC
jgi:glycosyltransferase involved in cell wall biosynthesis